jgi:hypothetical protein
LWGWGAPRREGTGMVTYISEIGILMNATADGIRIYQSQED